MTGPPSWRASAITFSLCRPISGNGSTRWPPDAATLIPLQHDFIFNENQNGAASVCYKDVLDNFSQKIKDDLVALPSSVHETILLPLQEKSNLDSLKEMVYDINRTILNPSEFLSDNVYVYNRQDKQLIIA